MANLKKNFNRIHQIIKHMGKERNEIRRLMNEIDLALQEYDGGEELLRLAREYYIEAMEKLEDVIKS